MVRRTRGPGPGALTLIGLAVILAVVAVYLRLRREPTQPDAKDPAGSAVVTVPPDAARPVVLDAAEIAVDAAAPRLDAAAARNTEETRPDAAGAPSAGAPSIDAASEPPPDAAGAPTSERTEQAKVLMAQASDALREGDFEKALRLADGSLKLRKTARTFLVKAQALQRLDRVESALEAVDQAEKVAPDYAAVFEWRGRILWSARRKDEARVQFEKSLELDPAGQRAAQIRRLLNGPR
ncbi:MAG: tetratricopeptide repeat protein [Kofleriaceae bacterium]